MVGVAIAQLTLVYALMDIVSCMSVALKKVPTAFSSQAGKPAGDKLRTEKLFWEGEDTALHQRGRRQVTESLVLIVCVYVISAGCSHIVYYLSDQYKMCWSGRDD
jgi:hypothetical protein